MWTKHKEFFAPLDERNYFVIKDGQRTARCYGRYNGGKAAAISACKPGESVSEGRNCPYPGCPCDADARPPCALCYDLHGTLQA